MSGSLDAALIFGFLSFFNFWGGAAIGAGVRGRRTWPVVWGCLVGGAPLYFGVERGATLQQWGWLAWQIGVIVVSALLVANRLARLRTLFLARGMDTLTKGT